MDDVLPKDVKKADANLYSEICVCSMRLLKKKMTSHRHSHGPVVMAWWLNTGLAFSCSGFDPQPCECRQGLGDYNFYIQLLEHYLVSFREIHLRCSRSSLCEFVI